MLILYFTELICDKNCDVYVEANECAFREAAGGGDGAEGAAAIEDHARGSGSFEGCRGEYARHCPCWSWYPHAE